MRFLAIILCVCMAFGLCACGGDEPGTASVFSSVTENTSSQVSNTETASSNNGEQGSAVASSNSGISSQDPTSDSTLSNVSSNPGAASSSKPSTGTASSAASSTGNTSSAQTPPTAPEVPVVNTYGNTGSNLYNGGFVAGQGDWIYFSNPSDNGYLYKMRTDGTGKQKLIDIAPKRSINVVGDWVYFFYADTETEFVCRVKNDGSVSYKKTIVGSGGNLYITDGYANLGGYYRFNSLFTESTEVIQIIRTGWNASFLGDNMFILKDDGKYNFNLWKARLDGSEMSLCSANDYVKPPLITEKYSVFNSDNKGVRVYDSAITKTVLIPNNTLEPFAIDDENDKLYYIQSSDNRLMRQDLITGEIKRYDAYATNINMVGDYIYYYNYDMAGKLYRIKTDGTGNEAV